MSSTIPASSGIYRITCTITGKFYIGSAINLHQRQRDHFSALRRNGHPNRKLQHAWNKHGEHSFIFEVLELVLIPDLLTAREQYWFDKLKPFGRKGFNLVPLAGSNLGMKASAETREKLRNSHLGQPGHWAGKKRSPETIRKVSASKLGKPSPRRPGYTHSPEHREKLRQANLGKKQRPETIEKYRLARLGHPVSAETRAKISAAKKRKRTHG